MKKVGLFGGSFNPIHLGHLAMARLAVDHFDLDEMIFIPAAGHAFEKESLTVSAMQRAEMVEKAIERDSAFSIWYGEIERGGVSYAIDTIETLQRERPETQFFYLIGMDNLPTFDCWHRYQDILNSVVLIVADRPGYSSDSDLDGDIRFFPSPHWGVSSSTIREYRSQGLSCRYMIHDSVEHYITENNLYSK